MLPVRTLGRGPGASQQVSGCLGAGAARAPAPLLQLRASSHRRHDGNDSRTGARLVAATAGAQQQPQGGPGAGGAGSQDANMKMDPAVIKERVDQAAAMLDEILEEIMRDLFVEQAASYITEQGMELSETQAVRSAVVQRIEFMDANFLAALNSYIQVASARAEADGGLLVGLLVSVRDEVLRQVALRLPPAARVMDRVLQEVDKDVRLGLLRKVMYGGDGSSETSSSNNSKAATPEQQQLPAQQAAATATGDAAAGAGAAAEGTVAEPFAEGFAPPLSTSSDTSSSSGSSEGAGQSGTGAEDGKAKQQQQDEEDELPRGVDADAIVATATQLIDDMEDQEVVADRRLLARMCLVREEVRWLEEERLFGPVSAGPYPPGQEAPERPDARGRMSAARFVRSNVPQRCIAFLKELLVVNDPTQRVSLLARALASDWDGAAPRQKLNRTDTAGKAGAEQGQQPDYVRPGRLMSTLQSMEAQLQEGARFGTGPAGNQDPAQRARVLRRLGDIRLEAVAVLDRIQRGAIEV